MGTIIVEQFNPVNGYWNKLYEVDSDEFDPDEPYKVNKYNGPYRYRVVDEFATDGVVDEQVEFSIEENFTVPELDEEEEEIDVDEPKIFNWDEEKEE